MGRGNVLSLDAHTQSTCSVMSHPSIPSLPSAYASSSYVKSSSLEPPSVSIPISPQVALGHSIVWQKELRTITRAVAGERVAVSIGWCIWRHWRLLMRRIEGGRRRVSKLLWCEGWPWCWAVINNVFSCANSNKLAIVSSDEARCSTPAILKLSGSLLQGMQVPNLK
jgi:hypothetical protein